MFGRGGEELLTLIKAGVDAEVVPGITSASGCTTAAGIPLTHRGLAQGCTFVTAHAETELSVDWNALAQINHTLVFYMGVSRAEMIASNLLKAGLSAATPVAIIENGCRENQREVIGQIKDLVSLVANNNVQSPALIVVGEVVSLANELNPELRAAVSAETLNQHVA